MILGITEAFKADSFKEKINLGVGAYRKHCPKQSPCCASFGDAENGVLLTELR
jgi:aspartate/tyrosine/aromatic aminotransferase